MYRIFRQFLALILSLSLAWLPMQSFADGGASAMTKHASQLESRVVTDVTPVQKAVHCHGSMQQDSTAAAEQQTGHKCCCDGCDAKCSNDCMHSFNIAVLEPVGVMSIDSVHTGYASLSIALTSRAWSPPIPPPLV